MRFLVLLLMMVVFSSEAKAQWPTLDLGAIKEAISGNMESVKQSKTIVSGTTSANKMTSALGDAKSSMSKLAGDKVEKAKEKAEKVKKEQARLEKLRKAYEERKQKLDELNAQKEEARARIADAKKEYNEYKDTYNDAKEVYQDISGSETPTAAAVDIPQPSTATTATESSVLVEPSSIKKTYEEKTPEPALQPALPAEEALTEEPAPAVAPVLAPEQPQSFRKRPVRKMELEKIDMQTLSPQSRSLIFAETLAFAQGVPATDFTGIMPQEMAFYCEITDKNALSDENVINDCMKRLVACMQHGDTQVAPECQQKHAAMVYEATTENLASALDLSNKMSKFEEDVVEKTQKDMENASTERDDINNLAQVKVQQMELIKAQMEMLASEMRLKALERMSGFDKKTIGIE